jgi:Ca2+/H+ antiporter, TMEM165/GDT1 family
MEINPGVVGLVAASFTASAVEFVEAFTIVLAMGMTRSWRSALVGTALAVVALAVVTAVLGVGLKDYVQASMLQIIIGPLLLVFGLQWLRKAILRSAGLKALHDEDAIFREEQDAARQAGRETRWGLDWFAFVVSFKGVFLEGLEVVFIVITFGLSAQKANPHSLALATAGAALAGVIVIIAGVLAHRPLSTVPENTLKFAVGLLLTTFGTFWSVEGLGYFAGGVSLEWPGGEWALPVVLLTWGVVSRLLVLALRRTQAAGLARATSLP